MKTVERSKMILFLAFASEISGIKSRETAVSTAEGNKMSGKAIPFIIPKEESAAAEVIPKAVSSLGTAALSAVRSMVLKYRPEVMGIGVVRFAEGKDGINNLMTIYSCFTGKTLDEIEREFEGRGYGDFKLAVGEACADALAPVQARYNELINDKAFLEAQMKKGAEEASYYARKTLSKVKRKVGFVQI